VNNRRRAALVATKPSTKVVAPSAARNTVWHLLQKCLNRPLSTKSKLPYVTIMGVSLRVVNTSLLSG
jgi:hypothetical protein